MGFAGDRCASPPDGWSGHDGRCTMRDIRSCGVFGVFMRCPCFFVSAFPAHPVTGIAGTARRSFRWRIGSCVGWGIKGVPERFGGPRWKGAPRCRSGLRQSGADRRPSGWGRRCGPTARIGAPIADRRCAGPRPGSSGAGWRRMSAVGPTSRPLPIPPARRSEAGADRKRRRTALPGGPAADRTRGHLPESPLHGTRPLRHPPAPKRIRPDRRPFPRGA